MEYKPAKTKKTQPKTESEVQSRDEMFTPNYGVDIIGKFIPTKNVWECAAGDGRFGKRLEDKWDKKVRYTEINGKFDYWNFLDDDIEGCDIGKDCAIITNPPFSLKQDFFLKCIGYKVPFALLIPLDYSQWLIDAIDKHGCEKLIPNRRISYLTPNILRRVHYGEIWKEEKKNYPTFKKYQDLSEDLWLDIVSRPEYINLHKYKRIDDVPNQLLAKYSSSDFHSGYLTWGFGFGKSETFVDLPIYEMKNNLV